MSTLTEFATEYQAIRDQFIQKGKVAFGEACKEVFETTPIKAIKIIGYTPFFADGDPCEYGIQSVEVTTKEIYLEDYDQNREWLGDYDLFEYAKDSGGNHIILRQELSRFGHEYNVLQKNWLFSWGEQINEFICGVHGLTDVIHDVFGDHVAVFITADEIVIEDYDNHD